MTIVQIETAPALEHAREIAALPGVDCLLIGPFDLGNNIGHPILTGKMAPELEDAIEKIKEAAHAEGKKVGIYCTGGEQAREMADKGFDMVSGTSRCLFICRCYDPILEHCSLGDGISLCGASWQRT